MVSELGSVPIVHTLSYDHGPMLTSFGNNSMSKDSSLPNLHCMWDSCSHVFDNSRELYSHLCCDHIQRRPKQQTGNGGGRPAPRLLCQWNGCNVSVLKRDHMTSHVRIHIDYKPYACSNCSRAFKRPQDLKKHAKTHAGTVPSTMVHNMGMIQSKKPSASFKHEGNSPIFSSSPTAAKRRALEASIELLSDVRESKISPEFSQSLAHRLTTIAPILDDVESFEVEAPVTMDLNPRALAEADDFLFQVSESITQHQHTLTQMQYPLSVNLQSQNNPANLRYEPQYYRGHPLQNIPIQPFSTSSISFFPPPSQSSFPQLWDYLSQDEASGVGEDIEHSLDLAAQSLQITSTLRELIHHAFDLTFNH